MKGTSPLNNTEIRRVSAAFTGTFETRYRGLFMIGVSTGGRISDLRKGVKKYGQSECIR